MSDVITTERINGFRLSIVLDSVGDSLYIYSVWLDVPYDARSMPCYVDQYVFDGEPTRKQLELLAKAKMREFQKTLTALINALPNAESVRNGVHEL
jgi:hypothetical protein